MELGPFHFRGVLPLLLCVLLQARAADEGRFPNNEDLRHYRTMDEPRLSPDGRQVLIQISDDTAHGGRPHVWLVEIDGKPPRQLTYSPPGADKNTKYRGEESGQWMPDGNSILFRAHRGEQTQLFRLPMNGGEALAFDLKVLPTIDNSTLPDALPPRAETKPDQAPQNPEPLPINVSGFKIAPDGKTIAIWAEDPKTPGEKKQEDEKADAVWVDHARHGKRLYLLEPGSSKLTPVAVPPNLCGVSWNPKADRLLAEVEEPNSASDLGPARSTWLVLTTDLQKPTKLPLPPTTRSTAWSLDGNNISFLAQAEAEAPPGYVDLYQFSVADGKVRNLSHAFQNTIGNETPIPDADGTVLQAVQNSVQLGFARFSASKGKPEPITFAAPVAHDLNTNERHNGWVYLASGSTEPDGLYFTSSLATAARALSIPPLTPPNVQASRSQLVRWNSDGRSIEGLLQLPEKPSGQRVPLILLIHGGPTAAWHDGYSPFVSFLVGRGWAVLRPNPRGSTGRGPEFAAANKNDLGGGDYGDVMAGLDAVLKQYPIDAERLALIGYSYGGEMAGFAIGKTTRFKAIVSGAPVIDQFSEYGTEQDSWYDRWFYGKPWEHFADVWRQSPLSGASKASTPFLLLQGKEDAVDPPGQSREMYRALRQMGVAVELVEYPREDHSPLERGLFGGSTTEPWHGFDARQRIVQFVERAFAATQR